MRPAVLSRPGRAPGTATRSGVPARWLVIGAAALLIMLASVALQVRRQAAAEADPRASGTLGGLSAQLDTAGWVSMDAHSQSDAGGYQMPAQMMPGAPEGDDMRLGVSLTLVNTDRRVREFDLATEFFLGGGRNEQLRPLHSDTFGGLARLSPDSAVDGFLYFDTVVPGAADPPLYLQWTRDGRTIRLAVPLTGSTPGHGHAS